MSDHERELLPVVLRKRYGISPGGYFLFVGAVEPKKNLRRLIDAVTMLEADIPLVVVGKPGWLWEAEIPDLLRSDGSRGYRHLDYVPGHDLRLLYGGALALAFPSLYEGFGLPPLEAMAFGVPVVTSRVSSLPEVCGEAAVYVDPYDPTDIRDGLARVLEDESLRARLVQEGARRVEHFGPAAYQERLQGVYRELL